jgi:S1-C subfamily serine protease
LYSGSDKDEKARLVLSSGVEKINLEEAMKKRMLTITTISVLAVMLLAACSSPLAIQDKVSNLVDSATQAQTAQAAAQAQTIPATDTGLLAAYQNTLQNLYTQVSPQVVNIRVVVKNTDQLLSQLPFELPELPFEMPGLPGGDGSEQGTLPELPEFSQGLGSGFVWDKEGHIVTNNHVVNGAEKIEVTFSDGTIVPAELVGADPYSDLAVIKVDMPADQLSPVTMAEPGQVKVGQLGVAIGNPYGLDGTMTVGIVSAVGRSVPAQQQLLQSGPSYSIPEVIQTDAPINPGNSGGVLVNDQGQVLGVTFAIESTSGANAGIGFVIPSSIVTKVVPSLIEDGQYEHPYLGVSAGDLTPDLATAMDLDAGQRGALVQDVVPGGPADKAGLRGSQRQVEIDGQQVRVGGDVIVAINDQPVKEMDDLIAYLASSTRVGEKATLTIMRDGAEEKISVTLEARPSQTAKVEQAEQAQTQTQADAAWLGILGIDLTAELAGAMDLQADQQGVLVQQVENNSPASQAGLRGGSQPFEINGESVLLGGDVIIAIDGKSIASIAELKAALADMQPGESVRLTILRDGDQQVLDVTLGQRPSNP